MQTNNLGYPSIGSHRELKKACEAFWKNKISETELLETGKDIRLHNWKLQKDAGIDLIPSGDFSFYDQILDMTMTVGAIPERYSDLKADSSKSALDLYFAMARGYQHDGLDITAMEMTKWFDTNYHYIVPEFTKDQQFKLSSTKIFDEYEEAKANGILTKPVIPGPVSYLLLGKEKEEGFHRIDLIEKLIPVYHDIFRRFSESGVEYVQMDEPFLVMDLDDKERKAFTYAYESLHQQFPDIKIILTTYFGDLRDNLKTALSLPVDTLHIDLVRSPEQLDEILSSKQLPSHLNLSLGLVDGRNIWKNDFRQSLGLIQTATEKLGAQRITIASSCSLLHSPCDLDLEKDNAALSPEIKQWLAFAKQKLNEITVLKNLSLDEERNTAQQEYISNINAAKSRQTSKLIHNPKVSQRLNSVTEEDFSRSSSFPERKELQNQLLELPLFPTTTIGSFPQTAEVRKWRADFKKGNITQQQYETFLKQEIEKSIHWQEDINMDVLVHGEFERNDMVEYFGEKLEGFAFTKFGWVQSYGSRCVKPPIIYGDVHRPQPMTVAWTAYAQSLTDKIVKGMLTGPVTILQWSFVRNDQPRASTCQQISLAIRDEVLDLEKAGIEIIQVDEPAIREGLPLRKSDWDAYLKWAVGAFKLATSGVKDETQIHTHMCYSEFNDIIGNIADMDADVITIECSRSQMELLDAFADFEYPNDIGPGVYDIHSPRVPSRAEMVALLEKAKKVIPAERLWVNPDCGLKTRDWKETKTALVEMIAAARQLRERINEAVV
ncbi:5-methyltetrahydropteroyltriglutamate--homocysteine S-methyltransferase [Fulvivirga kasyanovii]|uniref:5-methyltetrahydropteroyltriglutamate--homocysteine methyltransferase n=1 Tax=Fulvivirga kasyanovii TaxID=396812 RepID=A0ABW9RXA6_9BACT|nr:5-methyltetrahydropteroyltriglutamate--homocysteine S-methyltransferase [Fulvivirga kasyanovii]MTI27645.1 5-methyltetrahydropteroyltriglutamate--homocysteine S-methyltransferase [Fulvivirga kasyanovii]